MIEQSQSSLPSVKIEQQNVRTQRQWTGQQREELSFTRLIRKAAPANQESAHSKRTTEQQVRRAINCLTVFAPEIVTFELVEYLSNKVKAANQATTDAGSCNQSAHSAVKLESKSINGTKSMYDSVVKFTAPEFEQISPEIAEALPIYLRLLSHSQSPQQTIPEDQQSVVETALKMFDSRLEACAKTINKQAVWQLSEQHQQIVVLLLMDPQRSFGLQTIEKLSRVIRVLMNVECETISITQKEVMEVYLKIRSQILNKSPDLYMPQPRSSRNRNRFTLDDYIAQMEDGQSSHGSVASSTSTYFPDNYSSRVAVYKSRNPLDAVWDEQKERTLIECIKRVGEPNSTVRDYFKTKYPETARIATSDNIRNKARRIFRLALRKLCDCERILSRDMPHLVALQDSKIKSLLYYRDSSDLKRALLNFYTAPQLDPIIVKQTILTVNEHVAKMEKNMESIPGYQKERIRELERQMAKSGVK